MSTLEIHVTTSKHLCTAPNSQARGGGPKYQPQHSVEQLTRSPSIAGSREVNWLAASRADLQVALVRQRRLRCVQPGSTGRARLRRPEKGRDQPTHRIAVAASNPAERRRHTQILNLEHASVSLMARALVDVKYLWSSTTRWPQNLFHEHTQCGPFGECNLVWMSRQGRLTTLQISGCFFHAFGESHLIGA
jgi:hypothetical protein